MLGCFVQEQHTMIERRNMYVTTLIFTSNVCNAVRIHSGVIMTISIKFAHSFRPALFAHLEVLVGKDETVKTCETRLNDLNLKTYK